MSKIILIAADSEEISRFTALILSGEGFKLAKCTNALEAVEILKTRVIDVVVYKETAPNLSASAIAEIVRKTEGLSRTPIIFISEDIGILRFAKLLEKRIINIFLPRPFSNNQLINIVSIFLYKTERKPAAK